VRQFPAYVGDFADDDILDAIIAEHGDLDLVVHCAGRTVVADSVADPVGYYDVNVSRTVQLVASLTRRGVSRLIFSSSAAVYGTAPDRVISEETTALPANAYGRGKLIVEQMLTDVCAGTPLSALSLRYFNPIGTDPQRRTGPYDSRGGDVMSRLLEAAATGAPFTINGNDWPTEDGTPVRDFVHVWDVARAHVIAAHRWPLGEGSAHEVINLGSGHGTTVRQLAEIFNSVAPRPVEIRYAGRRQGDIAGGWTAIEKAARLLGYGAERTVEDGVRDAIAWAGQRVGAQ
jgi:UDP-glucose 4-epimerase